MIIAADLLALCEHDAKWQRREFHSDELFPVGVVGVWPGVRRRWSAVQRRREVHRHLWLDVPRRLGSGIHRTRRQQE